MISLDVFIFQDCPVSKPSGTSQSRSVGMMNKKVGLSGLVRVKPSGNPATKPVFAPVQNSSRTNEDVPPNPPTSGLSLLGSYSGSDSE